MPIRPFLAMTAAEILTNPPVQPICWMACHFSPYGLGLSNLPQHLPEHSLLMVDDITPIHGHDPALIARQLTEYIEALHCSAVLLDFQRPDCVETAALVRHLSQTLPCPVAASDLYGAHSSGPVFLPPVPPSVRAETHIAPWEGRELWLDVSLAGEVITLSEAGSSTVSLPFPDEEESVFFDTALPCHYRIATEDDKVRFTLWRSWEDLQKLLEEAENHGVTTAVGLYQELHSVGRGHDPADALI